MQRTRAPFHNSETTSSCAILLFQVANDGYVTAETKSITRDSRGVRACAESYPGRAIQMLSL